MAISLQALSKIEGGAKRLAEVATVLAKYGLADWLSDIDSEWVKSRLVGNGGERLTGLTTAERVRLALTDLGTSYIKLGQMLSTRPDVVGAGVAAELTRLQTGAPPDGPETVRATVKAELGSDPSALFAEFDDVPVASASIGQVHAATTKSGDRVVVKVMHAGIEEKVHRDLDIMLGLAELMEKHSPALRQYRPASTARNFQRTLLREMDFAYERRYLEEFAQNFRGDPGVKVPAVLPGLCSERVLTMEFLDGVAVSDRARLAASGEDLDAFARRGATMYLDMIFRDGFYHADPHPGNLLLLPGGVVGLLDCGMVGRLDEGLRTDIEAMLLAAVEPDADALVDTVCRVGSVPPELDRDELRAELSDLLAEYESQPVDDLDVGGALTRVLELVRGYRIVLPHGFALLLKTLVMLEGTARQIGPGFNLAELLRPYYVRALKRRLSPKRLRRDLLRVSREWGRLLDTLPRDLADIVSRARKGSFEVHLEHRRLESTVDRLVQGILAAAMFMGSSMLLASAVPPLLWGVSVVGALGMGLAVAQGAQLLWQIRASARRRDRGPGR